MFIVTFYSFKGGVGRSMALANIAAEMVRLGRRVLVVDFDLEAPGLDTFFRPSAESRTEGIVEFVGQYVSSGAAPDVSAYMYEVKDLAKSSGQLWVMPAGKQDENYNELLAKLSWKHLYERQDGYLLFEDLKKQWESEIKPDYVLIDSRTGYTDVGGICTRQLPNLVCVLFFPNTQNLRGLQRTVEEIRTEASGPRSKQIDLVFAMSNVPDLDDEDEILEQNLRRFGRALGLDSAPLTIHRYDSLSLVNQAIFTRDRPRSRLAKEYRSLLNEILKKNPEDREGSLAFLKQLDMYRFGRRAVSYGKATQDQLKRIQNSHASDGELLYVLGVAYRALGDIGKAESSLDLAIAAGHDTAEARLARARIRRERGDIVGGSADAEEALRRPEVTFVEIRQALGYLEQGKFEELLQAPSLLQLETRKQIELALALMTSKEGLASAGKILERIVQDQTGSIEDRSRVMTQLSLCFIGLGRYAEAVKVIGDPATTEPAPGIASWFNIGMARWGITGSRPVLEMSEVLRLNSTGRGAPASPNYLQCIALANWVIGNTDEAFSRAREAANLMRVFGEVDFSCWRYQYVSVAPFVEDISEMMRAFNEEALLPAFMRK